MKNPNFKVMLVASVVVGLGGTALVASAKDTKKMTLTPASEVVFEDMFPGQAGPKVATVSGDRKKGPHVSFIKLPAGMVSPMHTHTNDIEAVVISGVVSHWHEGEEQASAKPLPAGSYFKQPGKLKHFSACAPGADCVVAAFQKGKMDANMIDAPKAAAK